jgi:hypothetical protein
MSVRSYCARFVTALSFTWTEKSKCRITFDAHTTMLNPMKQLGFKSTSIMGLKKLFSQLHIYSTCRRLKLLN